MRVAWSLPIHTTKTPLICPLRTSSSPHAHRPTTHPTNQMVGERKEQRTRAHHNRLARELRGAQSHRDLVEPRPSLQTQLTPPSEPLPSKGLGTGVTGSFECGQGLGKAKAPCGRRLGRHKASLNVTGAEGQAKLEPIAMHKPPQEIFARIGNLVLESLATFLWARA